MRRLILATALVTVVSCTSSKPVLVTNEVIASLPQGRPYLIDITRRGPIYDVAAGIDYSRVNVRASDGELPFKEFMGRLTSAPPARTLVSANLEDLVGLLPEEDVGVSEAKCKDFACQCNGRRDCSDLSRSGKCVAGPGAAVCGQGAGGQNNKWGCTCVERK